MPKHVEIARRIEGEIQEGAWAEGRMPGVRVLAKRYGASVVTTSRALQELTDRGLISTVERSGCFVRPAAPPAGDLWALCQRITAGPWRERMEPVFEEGFEDGVRRAGGRLREDLLGFSDDTPDAELHRRLDAARDQGTKGVFFLPSRKTEVAADRDAVFLDLCGEVGLPVVLIERGLRGDRPLTTDVVAYDDLTAARDLTRHLIDLGRRRIAFVVGSPTSSHDARLAGYLLAVARDPADRPPIVLEEPAGVPAKEAFSRLADGLAAAGADAVLCYQDYTAVGLIHELLHRGRRVPADMAVAGFEDRPIGNTFAVGVTTYAFSDAEVGRRAVLTIRDRIANPDAPPSRISVTGRLVVRESTARPGD